MKIVRCTLLIIFQTKTGIDKNDLVTARKRVVNVSNTKAQSSTIDAILQPYSMKVLILSCPLELLGF